MFEVYTSTRAGRPTLLLLLTAGALMGALCLAWAQVHASRALGEEVRFEGTPLAVRPPLGWVQGSDNRRVFGKPVRKRIWGREVWAAERSIEFYYNDYFIQLTRLFEASSSGPALPARIGGLKALQFVVRPGGLQAGSESIYRWARTPDGGQISVEYTPLAEVSHGDLDLLDDVCDAVRLRFSGRPTGRAETLADVGVRFPVADDWQVVGPDDRGGLGLYVQKVERDLPVWALAIFRRALPRGLRPVDLLVSEAEQLLRRYTPPRGTNRADGSYVGVVSNPDVAQTRSVFVSVWVVVSSPFEAAVVYVLADPRYAQPAHEAAAEVAPQIEFVSEFPR